MITKKQETLALIVGCIAFILFVSAIAGIMVLLGEPTPCYDMSAMGC